jgi:hypothetical protein
VYDFDIDSVGNNIPRCMTVSVTGN